ncbi:MAG: hypothetical protein ACREEG_12965 [Phenylobacterium sp.]
MSPKDPPKEVDAERLEPFSDEEPGPEQIRRDEEQTERQAPNDAGPGEAAG